MIRNCGLQTFCSSVMRSLAAMNLKSLSADVIWKRGISSHFRQKTMGIAKSAWEISGRKKLACGVFLSWRVPCQEDDQFGKRWWTWSLPTWWMVGRTGLRIVQMVANPDRSEKVENADDLFRFFFFFPAKVDEQGHCVNRF